MDDIKYHINNSTYNDVYEHLNECSNEFVPKLDSYVDIESYSDKIVNKSIRFEAFYGTKLVGLIAVYIGDDLGFITNVSIDPEFHGIGLSKRLLNLCIENVNKGGKKIKLEVNKDNLRAISFYIKNGFGVINTGINNLTMELKLERNYNKEFKNTKDHKYNYNFDFDVMHNYMIKSFEPFFKGQHVLELGSFKGDFTKKLLDHFEDVTCVEASSEAIKIAKKNIINDKVTYHNSLFEDLTLNRGYDNIVLTHVLEHIDNPVGLLGKINDEWLSDNGRLLIVCPNANAPSRRIAVKMGLITHNSAITPSEKEHGHRVTYSLDTLERDIGKSGLNVVHKSGIFFKALANFQWDRLLNTDIISKEYLDGCYKLGLEYPDLCSSIFFVCEKK